MYCLNQYIIFVNDINEMGNKKENARPIEYRRYIDEDTGEVHEVPVMFHSGKGNKNFEMIFYGHLLDILNDLGSKKIQVLNHIITNRNKSQNVFIGTQKDISEALSINIMTVNKTLAMLEDKEVIKRKTGVIYIDANVICDGRFKDRIMHVYNNITEERTIEEQTRSIEREISRKYDDLRKLENIKVNLVEKSQRQATEV